MKSREHVVTNGRAVFYASMWEDLKKAATNCGWALGLHGSLNSDMDIMAMPWTENAVSPEELISELCKCFTGYEELRRDVIVSQNKPNNRLVYTLPIWADFYLDINIITSSPPLPSAEQQGWISVKDGTPTFGNVIVCIGGKSMGAFCNHYKELIIGGYVRTEEVTHWMPLPSPPVEEKDTKK